MVGPFPSAARDRHTQLTPRGSALAKTRHKTTSPRMDPTTPPPACHIPPTQRPRGAAGSPGSRGRVTQSAGDAGSVPHEGPRPAVGALPAGQGARRGSALVSQAGSRSERQHHLVSDVCSTEEASPVLGQRCPVAPCPISLGGGLWGRPVPPPSSPSGFWRRLGLLAEMSLISEKSPAWRPRMV